MSRRSLQVCLLALCLTGLEAHADGGIYIMPYGQVVDRQGNTVSEGNTVSGQSGDSLVGSDGKVYSADELKVNNRGKLVKRDGGAFEARKRADTPTHSYSGKSSNFTSSTSTANARTKSEAVSIKSLTGSSNQSTGASGPASGASSQTQAEKPRRQYAGPGVKLYLGGSSENGVARIGKLPIIP